MSAAISGNERDQDPDIASLIRATLDSLAVIASEAKQSMEQQRKSGLLRFARNDGKMLRHVGMTEDRIYFPYPSRILAWIFAIPAIQRS
jgi:hypothetical protein